MPTKTSTSLTAFDDFLNARDNAIPDKKENIVPIAKTEQAKKSINNATPKASKPIVSKVQTEITKPVVKENVVPVEVAKVEENKQETTQPQIQRVGFSTILKPDLIRKLKLKALTDDIDIYEAVEKAIELFLNS